MTASFGFNVAGSKRVVPRSLGRSGAARAEGGGDAGGRRSGQAPRAQPTRLVRVVRDLRRVARREREFAEAWNRSKTSEGVEAAEALRAELRQVLDLVKAPLGAEDDVGDDGDDEFGFFDRA